MNGMTSSEVCVIVPTYNNEKTLKRVLASVLAYVGNVIVVNDGSTDGTAAILQGFPEIITIHFPKNSGKGMALRTGFRKAIELRYKYAITIDSDGQHFASDIPRFMEAVAGEEDTLFIGWRDMMQDGIPKKSSFGNKFSNFWFLFETGIRLADTQSGFRLYPLRKIPKKYFTSKFEFEIEVIVRSAWKGISVKNIPIQVLYDPAERVSHFRPFKDFTRISILNTVLVVIALAYIKPRDLFRSLKKKGLRRFLIEDILQSNDSAKKKSLSIALGVFIGISPLWGFQTAAVLFLAFVFKLNKTISFTFSNVSIPPLIPFIIYASLSMGSWVTQSKMALNSETFLTFSGIGNNIQNYLVGSILLAFVLSTFFGLSGFAILSVINALKNKR
jgi:glycosyltransferase involved in cell wall biosynthesis